MTQVVLPEEFEGALAEDPDFAEVPEAPAPEFVGVDLAGGPDQTVAVVRDESGSFTEVEIPFDTIETAPWTDANDEQLLIMARCGKPFGEILDVLNRSPDDVEDRLDQLAPEPRSPTTIGAALAKVRARIALNNAQAVTAPPPDPGALYWTPERDFQLVQGIIGSGLPNTIAAMGITKEEACARWSELLPRKGIAEQAKLVAKLVAKLKAAAGRAA